MTRPMKRIAVQGEPGCSREEAARRYFDRGREFRLDGGSDAAGCIRRRQSSGAMTPPTHDFEIRGEYAACNQ